MTKWSSWLGCWEIGSDRISISVFGLADAGCSRDSSHNSAASTDKRLLHCRSRRSFRCIVRLLFLDRFRRRSRSSRDRPGTRFLAGLAVATGVAGTCNRGDEIGFVTTLVLFTDEVSLTIIWLAVLIAAVNAYVCASTAAVYLSMASTNPNIDSLMSSNVAFAFGSAWTQKQKNRPVFQSEDLLQSWNSHPTRVQRAPICWNAWLRRQCEYSFFGRHPWLSMPYIPFATEMEMHCSIDLSVDRAKSHATNTSSRTLLEAWSGVDRRESQQNKTSRMSQTLRVPCTSSYYIYNFSSGWLIEEKSYTGTFDGWLYRSKVYVHYSCEVLIGKRHAIDIRSKI